MTNGKHTRRKFIGGVAVGLALSGCRLTDRGSLPVATEVPRRKLGSTGESVSMIGLGGYHIGKPSEAEGIALMHAAIERGINFFDNCWSYHAGESERRMGKALKGRRQQVFLMSKIDGRTRAAAAQQIEQCLSRLQTDYVDLMQVHEVIRMEDGERVFSENGAIAALLAAQQAGKVRFLGFTGHKSPAMHLEMLAEAERHGLRFDAVQMPLNPMDPHFDSFELQVLPLLRQRGIGVLGMKALGGGILLDSGVVKAEECLHYALSLPTDVVITGMESMDRLQQAVAVASSFRPMSAAQRTEILARTASVAGDGAYEKFKTTHRFDGTLRNPHWLTTADVEERAS